MLTDTAIRKAKLADKPLQLFDSSGLYLEVLQPAASCGGPNTNSTGRKSGSRWALIQI